MSVSWHGAISQIHNPDSKLMSPPPFLITSHLPTVSSPPLLPHRQLAQHVRQLLRPTPIRTMSTLQLHHPNFLPTALLQHLDKPLLCVRNHHQILFTEYITHRHIRIRSLGQRFQKRRRRMVREADCVFVCLFVRHVVAARTRHNDRVEMEVSLLFLR
jgi:hypothetical protein